MRGELSCDLSTGTCADVPRREDLPVVKGDGIEEYEAERCQRIAFLSRGHLIAVGTVDEITAQFRQPSIEDVFIELQRRDEGAVV